MNQRFRLLQNPISYNIKVRFYAALIQYNGPIVEEGVVTVNRAISDGKQNIVLNVMRKLLKIYQVI